MEGRQQSRPGFDQHHPGRPGIYRAKVGGQRPAGEFSDGAGQFHAGWTAADYDETQEALALLRVDFDLGLLESQQDISAQQGGVVDALETGREFRPVVMSEIAVLRARGDYEKIIGHVAIFSPNGLGGNVDPLNVGKHDCGVGLLTEHAADWRGDIRGGEPRCRHLIKERLKQMVIVPINHHDIDRRIPQRPCGRETAEACPDDYDPLAVCGGLAHGV